jgi:glycosyltransferase involved in cell wall biosynthesis
VVFTTPILSHPPIGGPALRIENSILALAGICDLHVHCRAEEAELGDPGAADFYAGRAAGFSFAGGRRGFFSRHRPGQRPAWLERACGVVRRLDSRRRPSGEAAEIVALARNLGARVVWFGYGNISYEVMQEVRRLDPGLRLVCDTDSVWSRFVLRELELESDPARRQAIEAEGRRKEEEEKAWVAMCDVTTAVSEVDAEYYRSLLPGSGKVRLFRNVINLDAYASPPAPAADLRHPAIFLAGSFWPKSPMEHAARWFVTEVLPEVLRAVPAATLYIAGKDSDRILADLARDNVRILGRVDSVLPYLCHADAAIVPLFFESGTRFKILEAGACGIAVVSTTLGAEGIEVGNGVHLLLADDPASFAAAVVKVLRDPVLARDLGSRLRDLVARDYSLDSLALEGREILDMLA